MSDEKDNRLMNTEGIEILPYEDGRYRVLVELRASGHHPKQRTLQMFVESEHIDSVILTLLQMTTFCDYEDGADLLQLRKH